MATFDSNLKAVTQSALLPKAVDTVLKSNVWTVRVLSNAKRWRGETLDRSIQVSTPTTGGAFSGLDTFDTSASDTKQRASFDLRMYYQSIVIPGSEADVNAVSDKVVRLAPESMEEGAQAMADGVGTALYSDGTGTSNKQFLGLLAAADDGDTVATYGGLARATYTTWAGNDTAVGGALTLAGMATMYDTCKVGTDKPTVILTTESVWSDYEALNQPTIQNQQSGYRQLTARGKAKPSEALKGEMGFDALMYRGCPVVADEKCTSGYMFFVNERWMAFYSLKSTMEGATVASLGSSETEGYYSTDVRSKDLAFNWLGWKYPVNQYGWVGQLVLMGNLVTFNPNRHGILTGIS